MVSVVMSNVFIIQYVLSQFSLPRTPYSTAEMLQRYHNANANANADAHAHARANAQMLPHLTAYGSSARRKHMYNLHGP